MKAMIVEQDGIKRQTNSSFYRGENTNFYPDTLSYDKDNMVSEYIAKGWMPSERFIDRATPIAAFGSCFAANISSYLHERGFNLLTKRAGGAYVTRLGEGMANTFAIRQQFEWAWEGKVPTVSLWHGYSAEEFGYDEAVRLETKEIFDQVDVFIITLGLSEVWYDEPTGEVFWRAIPLDRYDPARHKFRVSTVAENLENLRAIHRLIRTHRPDATIVFTVSPVPLQATFRNVTCLAANAVSKSILRVAVDELYRELTPTDAKLFYFPSFEVVMYLFNNAWATDRRHPRPAILRFNMEIFERYFCQTDLDDAGLLASYRLTRTADLKIGSEEIQNRMHVRKAERLAEKDQLAERRAANQARRTANMAKRGIPAE